MTFWCGQQINKQKTWRDMWTKACQSYKHSVVWLDFENTMLCYFTMWKPCCLLFLSLWEKENMHLHWEDNPYFSPWVHLWEETAPPQTIETEHRSDEHPKYLGLTLDKSPAMKPHINNMTTKTAQKLNLPWRITSTNWGVNKRTMKLLSTDHEKSMTDTPCHSGLC